MSLAFPTPDPLLALSTDSVAPPHRYDYWCQAVFGCFDADPLPPDEALAFEGHVVSLIGERGEIHRYQSSAMSGRRTQAQYRLDTGDEISISYMLAGEAIYEPEGRAPVVASNANIRIAVGPRGNRSAAYWRLARGLCY
jgi:hypothetical protein